MIGFGIDLAGYATGKTSLAVVEINSRSVQGTLLCNSALSKKRNGNADLEEALVSDTDVIRHCLAIGPIAVDIPIDFQGLPNPENPKRIWQLTRRPIDRAVNAMPPFADRIGAPAARFAAIMRYGNFADLLGERIFEAYPGGTLKTLEIAASKYKGKDGADNLVALCSELKFESAVQSDDHIDAIICAITAAMPSDQMRDAGLFKIEGPLPKGFRIPKSLSFDKIQVRTADFDVWLRQRESHLVA